MQRLVVKQQVRTSALMKLDQSDYNRSAYDWNDLGVVCRGHRNDEGVILVEMHLGFLKNLGARVKDYPEQLIDVVEKYYGEQYGVRHATPHLTERVLWRKPKNLIKLIKKYKGKDMRTKW